MGTLCAISRYVQWVCIFGMPCYDKCKNQNIHSIDISVIVLCRACTAGCKKIPIMDLKLLAKILLNMCIVYTV